MNPPSPHAGNGNGKPAVQTDEPPRGDLAGFGRYLRYDVISGFLVFLIAMPLCLSIALAYGFPPIAGVFTAIIGGIVTTFISNSELTIKGPAAGLIAIAAPCVMAFGWSGVPGDFNFDAYRAALAVGVAAGIIQILFGVFRVGSLGEFFPSSAVHGMLAAIGIIILAKQIPPTLGVSVKGEPLELLMGVPKIIEHMNPSIAVVGLISLFIMFLWPLVKVKSLKAIPAAVVVIVVAIPMAKVLDLDGMHTRTISLEESGDVAAGGGSAEEGAKKTAPAANAPDKQSESDTLIHVPKFGETFNAITTPDFSALKQAKAWRWVLMFAIIGTLESMLSAKAMDLIDPWKRKTSLDRDNIAVGVGNVLCACVGAAPMISEIVRSRANMDNGARTRFADMYHAIFLLLFVSLLPFVVSMIPIAALAAMLIYTGYRLAHPREFVHVFKIGREQLIIYCVTIVGVLWTDLLIGIGIGIGTKVVIHLINGAPVRSLFKPNVEVFPSENGVQTIKARDALLFTNWLPFRKRIVNLGLNEGRDIHVDLSAAVLIDHTAMENLHNLQRDFAREGHTLEIIGLETHQPTGETELSARKRGLASIKRITVISASAYVEHLVEQFTSMGATGYTITECRGAGREQLAEGTTSRVRQMRVEVMIPSEEAGPLIEYLRTEVLPDLPVTASVETVEVIRADKFRIEDHSGELVAQAH